MSELTQENLSMSRVLMKLPKGACDGDLTTEQPVNVQIQLPSKHVNNTLIVKMKKKAVCHSPQRHRIRVTRSIIAMEQVSIFATNENQEKKTDNKR